MAPAKAQAQTKPPRLYPHPEPRPLQAKLETEGNVAWIMSRSGLCLDGGSLPGISSTEIAGARRTLGIRSARLAIGNCHSRHIA